MAKKKASKQKTSPQKEFSSSPFKDLKGLSAFKEQTPPSKGSSDLKNDKTCTKVTSPGDEGSFADEMDFLGVKPLSGKAIKETASNPGKATPLPDLPKHSREDEEKNVFLDALGSMEKTFVDEWSDEEPAKKAAPRRMKQVERGQLMPEAELDLHGLTVEEATAKVSFFLQDALYQGFRTVLIITGKGLHSNDGPVLRAAMEKLLGTQRELVLEWGLAPKRYGGSGALVVFLRQVEIS